VGPGKQITRRSPTPVRAWKHRHVLRANRVNQFRINLVSMGEWAAPVACAARSGTPRWREAQPPDAPPTP
jgi:hypothetical protein